MWLGVSVVWRSFVYTLNMEIKIKKTDVLHMFTQVNTSTLSGVLFLFFFFAH